MDAERMHALACQYAAEGGEEALHAALSAALPLCALIARRFAGRGVEYEDLYQVASMACVSALRKFEPERGLKFTTFVTPTVTGAVRNYLRDKAELMRTPRGVREEGARLAAAREAFLRAQRREPSPRELAEQLGWELGRVLNALAAQASRQVASLEQKGEDGLSLAERAPFWEAGFERTELRADLQKALTALTETEKTLLRLRFSRQMSQRDAAQALGFSQMQVSRMERRILAALRKEMNDHENSAPI